MKPFFFDRKALFIDKANFAKTIETV